MAVMVTVKMKGKKEDGIRDYERIGQELVRRGFGRNAVLSHCAAATDDGLMVVDVWPNEQAWNDFLKRGLKPAFQAAGLKDPPEVHLFKVHNMGWPGKFGRTEEEARPQ
jgi:hypothetical protein